VHVARGGVKVNGVVLAAGDAARIESEAQVNLTEGVGAEVLVFDLE
jgi:redox-sensitive bicupin YhaK (pirin superfamily)